MLLLVLLVLCSLGEAFAKDYLVIYKPGKQQRYYYYVGDQIKLRPQRNFPMRSGAIYAFSDSALYFSPDDSILYSEIDYIQLRDKAEFFPKQLWAINLLSTGLSTLAVEAGYLASTGAFSPFVGASIGVAVVVTVVPILVNSGFRLFRRTKCYIGPNDFKIGVVSMPG
ncbi:MAG: hypothetical protein EP332_04730 [Bacteroidetes bacterium]|nr:MAG: hypothetical protein EP332_04730 [Bacteroidota bacterium]